MVIFVRGHAWATAKAQQSERFEHDPKARVAWERRMARNAERSVKADAKMYAREHGWARSRRMFRAFSTAGAA